MVNAYIIQFFVLLLYNFNDCEKGEEQYERLGEEMENNKRIEKRIKEDVLDAMKPVFQNLYINYRQLSSDQIRLIALEAITQHVSQKSRLALNRKIRAKTKVIHEILDPQTSIQAKELQF